MSGQCADRAEQNIRELISGIVHDPETARFLFIAESEKGEWFSVPCIEDDSGSSEAEMIAEYVATISARTDRGVEEILREIVFEINSRPVGTDTDRSNRGEQA